ncbi:MAG TPA: HD domain-containing protein [Ktedonobacteraceae bacterium]|nr:HD domain-containing protein [Ktedonobacteraceae bacterium]
MDARILHILKQTAQHFNDNHAQAYLVGGSLRNLLLGEPTIDWDIVTGGDAPTLARQLANKLGGFYAHLHEKASRVVVKQQAGETVLDISPLNGKTIEDDLRRRDFTINAMAAPLDEIVRYLEQACHAERSEESRGTATSCLSIIDPTGGTVDSAARRLRAVDNDIFKHDPLRMLRAVRLMMRYGLSIEPETQRLIAFHAPLLKKVAPERLHDELYAILNPDGATDRLRFLDELGLFTVIFPEFIPARGMRQPFPHYWDVLEHSIEAVGALERLAGMLQGEIADGELHEICTLLREAGEQGIFSFDALLLPRVKMAALLHDIGKTVTYATDQEGHIHFYHHPQAGVPLAQEIMRRLRASTQDRRFVQQVVAHHMRPGQLGQDGPVTLRATRRYFADLGLVGIYVALISLADHLAAMGPQPLGEAWERHLGVVHVLLTRYIRERETILPPRLISAEELMRRLQLEPGPQVGRLLDLIAEAQAEGCISSKEEAIWLAEDAMAIDEDAQIGDEDVH